LDHDRRTRLSRTAANERGIEDDHIAAFDHGLARWFESKKTCVMIHLGVL